MIEKGGTAPFPDPAQLMSMLYVSHSLTTKADDMRDIVAVSRSRNAACDVTGALANTGRHFAQILEGPRAAIDELMRSIAADPRHEGLQVIHFHPIESRDFKRWSLTYWAAATARVAGGQGAMDAAIADARQGDGGTLYDLIAAIGF